MVRVGLVSIGFGSHVCNCLMFVKVEYMVRGLQTVIDVGERDGSRQQFYISSTLSESDVRVRKS
jgi:hypothetical protein